MTRPLLAASLALNVVLLVMLDKSHGDSWKYCAYFAGFGWKLLGRFEIRDSVVEW